MSHDLEALGLNYEHWQDAVEAAIATNNLSVTGEVRGGQLIQYADPSGAQINILAVEPFATFAGFEAETTNFGHIAMINDVLALVEVVDCHGAPITTLTVNLAQGPLLVDESQQRWQQVGITALVDEHTLVIHPDEQRYRDASGRESGYIESPGAEVINAGSAASAPTAAVKFSARVLQAEYRRNALNGQQFIHCTIDASIALDLCMPYQTELPVKGSVITGEALLVGSVVAPQGCSSGGCGCGSGGCGSH
ncbi:hypothetical protein N7326_01300 [Corynebacterium sp. ES2794-CONJ1]|uniref:hypothetical protein n=1 Tax=unclassified Corynebacterium TaxID=2624378 RepID=UPI0021687424|nr:MULTISPECIES: hypothetical protein [unclassified Corynebacterium]MCS4489167.1 hypothetical protein [Corynebacterium sp. ES2775-CONJ]MCS4490981.1 hypothetical protein [Corynebacterium sp. ES2715-CONJ3]MCS4531139.1 hypothetical protein [Corynebacterium sp. ES2730-CONJ]MCU9518506.1 hypothetical protein [Corynebacterium sp. ES2794-CONJ1]